MPTPSIQTLVTDAQQILNLDSISAVRSVVAVALANANTGTPLNPNLTTQQLWNEFYQVVNKPKSDIESIIANQLMKMLFAPPAPGGVGADKQVIFNDNGVLAGDPQFLWNKTTNLLTVTGSATITGDLTVDTSTLKVDSANNRVGVGTASPANTLEVVAPAGDNIVSTFRSGDATAANNAGGGFRSISSATAASRVAQIWLDADGANFSGGDYFYIQKNGNSGTVEFNQSSNAAMTFLTNSTERARIDSSGNVGIGVTPSAWTSSYKAIQVGTVGSLSSGSSSTFGAILASNLYQAAGGNAFIGNGYATRYDVRADTGSHVWYTSNNNTLGAGQIVSFSTAMTLDASGNLGVGEVAPSGQKLSVNGAASVRNGNKLYLWDTGNSTAHGIYNAGDNLTFIKNNSTASMTLDASGNLLVGTTSVGGVFDTKFYLSSNAGTNKWAVGPYSTATNFAIIPTPGTGGVYLSGTSATSWTAYSDERLKDIIEPISNAIAKVGSLRCVIGKFKGDETNTRRPFLIAQDLQSALPEAVDSSNPDRLGVAYTDVIPLLVAAIKELTARVEALEA